MHADERAVPRIGDHAITEIWWLRFDGAVVASSTEPGKTCSIESVLSMGSDAAVWRVNTKISIRLAALEPILLENTPYIRLSGPINLEITGIDNSLVFVDDVDLFEATFTVDVLDMLLSVIHQNLSYVLHISSLTISNDLLSNFRVFGEQIVLQKSFAEGYALYVRHGHEDEFGLLVCTHIVIANKCARFLFDSELELLSRQALSHQIVSDAHGTFLNEVHIRYFMLLVQNKLIIINIIKLLGSESEADIVKELRIVIL